MSAPVTIAPPAEIDEIDAEAIELAVANALLCQFAARVHRVGLPALLTATGSLGAVCVVAQLVKWISRCW